jgi:hypothetical protein
VQDELLTACSKEQAYLGRDPSARLLTKGECKAKATSAEESSHNAAATPALSGGPRPPSARTMASPDMSSKCRNTATHRCNWSHIGICVLCAVVHEHARISILGLCCCCAEPAVHRSSTKTLTEVTTIWIRPQMQLDASADSCWRLWQAVREKNPLIQCITNFVSMVS